MPTTVVIEERATSPGLPISTFPTSLEEDEELVRTATCQKLKAKVKELAIPCTKIASTSEIVLAMPIQTAMLATTTTTPTLIQPMEQLREAWNSWAEWPQQKQVTNMLTDWQKSVELGLLRRNNVLGFSSQSFKSHML